MDSKDIQFFKYPRLGAFYGIAFKIKSYLSDKVYDSNKAKIEAYEKAKAAFDTEQEEELAKFNESCE